MESFVLMLDVQRLTFLSVECEKQKHILPGPLDRIKIIAWQRGGGRPHKAGPAYKERGDHDQRDGQAAQGRKPYLSGWSHLCFTHMHGMLQYFSAAAAASRMGRSSSARSG